MWRGVEGRCSEVGEFGLAGFPFPFVFYIVFLGGQILLWGV